MEKTRFLFCSLTFGIDWDDYHFLNEHDVFELNLKNQEQTYENGYIKSVMKSDESKLSNDCKHQKQEIDGWELASDLCCLQQYRGNSQHI